MSEGASWQSPFTAEMNERMAHLEVLPAYLLKEDLEALQRCLYTFTTNANELTTQWFSAAHPGPPQMGGVHSAGCGLGP